MTDQNLNTNPNRNPSLESAEELARELGLPDDAKYDILLAILKSYSPHEWEPIINSSVDLTDEEKRRLKEKL